MYGRNGAFAGKIRPSHAKQPLVFEVGNKMPPAGLVEWLGRVPYPEKGDRTLRATMNRKEEALSMLRLEFGVFCKDGVFSPEYVQSMKKGTQFHFDNKWKTFRLSQLIEAEVAGQSPSTRLLVVKASSVRLILSSVSNDEFSVTLILSHPPAYEQLKSKPFAINTDSPELDQNGNPVLAAREYTGRQRRPAWDHDHQVTSAFTSRTIRFVFDTENLRNDFEDLLEDIGCQKAKYVDMEDEPRRLYANRQRKAVHEWFESCMSRMVAFQIARLYQNCLLTPAELLALRPDIDAMLETKGANHAADVLHQFVEELSKLEDRWFDRISKDKRHKRKLPQGIDLAEKLAFFVEKGRHKVDWSENHSTTLMQCLHVVLTPTSMILEGPYPDQSNRPLRCARRARAHWPRRALTSLLLNYAENMVITITSSEWHSWTKTSSRTIG